MRTLMTIFVFVIMVVALVIATKSQPTGRWDQNNKERSRPDIGDQDDKDRRKEFDQGRGHDSGIKGNNERRPNFGDHGCDGRDGHGRDRFDDSSYPGEIGARSHGKTDYGRSGVRGTYGDQGSRSGGYGGSRFGGYGGSRSGNFEKTRSGGYEGSRSGSYGGSRTGSYGGSRTGSYGYANKRYGA